jgi:hypothetical protein
MSQPSAIPDPKRAAEEAEKAEKERAEVHPLDWQDEWGPLTYKDFSRFVHHMQQIERAAEDPAKQQALCAKHGYRDVTHFGRVRTTFLKYWGEANSHAELRWFIWDQGMLSQAAMESMQIEREDAAREAIAKNPQLLAPEEGVTIEQYAWVCANVAGRNIDMPQLAQLLAQVQMDIPKWERVNKAWVARMGADPTGTITMAFTKGYTGAGAGQYGAAAQAAAQAMSGAPGTAPAGAEPVSLEKYAEIGVAMGAWSKQGKDVNAMLQQHFGMNAGDLSNIGMYWSQRWMADISLLSAYERYQNAAKPKWETPAADADLSIANVFANAAQTSQQAPGANAQVPASLTMKCPTCGASQEKPLDFLCKYCRNKMA